MRFSTKLARMALSPISLVLLFFLFDAVVPYLIRTAKLVEMPVISWRPKLLIEEYDQAFRYYFLSILLLAVGYLLGSYLVRLIFNRVKGAESIRVISRSRAWLLLAFSFLLCLSLFCLKISDCENWGAVFEKRWIGKSSGEYSGPIDFLRSLSIEIVFVSVGMLIFSRPSTAFGLPSFFAVVIGWITASTTLSRGTQLGFFLGLMAMCAYDPLYLKRWRKRKTIPLHVVMVITICCALFCFIGYGVMRQEAYISEVTPKGGSVIIDSLITNVLQFVRGDGLEGLAAIISSYGTKLAFLDGRTVKDTLMFPIPRLLWADKPTWYGIDAITRGMGWPSSTQSAVTIAGEGYANFGPIGIILAFIVGILLGILAYSRNSIPLMSIYCFILLPGIFTSMWMSTIGFINSYFRIPFLSFIVVVCCCRKKSYARPNVPM